jgi:hypothetical protein
LMKDFAKASGLIASPFFLGIHSPLVSEPQKLIRNEFYSFYR